MASIILTLGDTGLVKADIGLRFYVAGVLSAPIVAGLTLIELSGLDYRLSGLPDGEPGDSYAVTWEYPEGAGFVYAYPEPLGAPASIVIPVRETGLAATDFDLALYQNGVAQPIDDLTATEAVPGQGDYVLTGWPSTAGEWLLVWRHAGLSFQQTWTVAPVPSGDNRFLHISAVQRPFIFDLDESNRPMFSANYNAMGEWPVTRWEESIVALLASNALAAPGTDTFVGTLPTIPMGDGPFTLVIDTGGAASLETHDGVKYERLSAQIIVRGATYEIGRTRALDIWRTLDGLRDVTITPVTP